MSLTGTLVCTDEQVCTDVLEVRPGEVVERQVFVNTDLRLHPGSVVRYCTLGNCKGGAVSETLPKPAIECCLLTSETDIAKLWDMAAGHHGEPGVGHLAP